MTPKQKIKLIFLVLPLLSGCADYHEVEVLRGFSSTTSYVLFCIDEVEYIKTRSGITGHFKPDGSLHTCEDGEHK